MTKIVYRIVQHDGGWAYEAGGVFSEPYPSHDLARRVAEQAAREQTLPGEETAISYETADGVWREELAEPGDRPDTAVEG